MLKRNKNFNALSKFHIQPLSLSKNYISFFLKKKTNLFDFFQSKFLLATRETFSYHKSSNFILLKMVRGINLNLLYSKEEPESKESECHPVIPNPVVQRKLEWQDGRGPQFDYNGDPSARGLVFPTPGFNIPVTSLFLSLHP